MIATVSPKLSNLQLELLQLYAQNVNDDDLIAIKKLIARYFADKAMDAMDSLWEERGYTNDTMIEWANSHDRVSSKSKH